jgi:hypothetical protein
MNRLCERIYIYKYIQNEKKQSVDPINQSLMVSDVFLFVRLDEPIHRHTHTKLYHMLTQTINT